MSTFMPTFMPTFISLALLISLQVSAGVKNLNFETIDSSSLGNRKTHFRVDQFNNVHLVYTGCPKNNCDNMELKYALRSASGEWQIQSLDDRKESTGIYASLEVTPDNDVFIAYNFHHKRQLHLMTKKMGKNSFSHKVLAQDAGLWISTVYTDRLYIANTTFPAGDWTGEFALLGFSNDGEENFKRTDSTFESGWFNNLVMDQNNALVFTYLSEGYFFGKLTLGMIKDGKLVLETIDKDVLKSSVAVDKGNEKHVVYQKRRFDQIGYPINSHNLVYAKKDQAGNWVKTILTEGGDDFHLDTGLHPNMFIDSKGTIHVVYRNFANKSLMYLKKDASGWSKPQRLALGGLYSFIQESKDGKILISHDNGQKIELISFDI